MSIVTIGVFGVVLNNHLDAITRVIEDPSYVGYDLIIEAGNQARRTIEQVQLSYADSLHLTIDKIEAKALSILRDVGILARGIVKYQAGVIQDAVKNSMLILNAIPFDRVSEVPLLLSMSPRFIYVPEPSDTDCKVQITFRGNFLKAIDPKLKFPNIECDPTVATIARLDFEVPFDAIFEKRIGAKIASSLPGELIIPYKFGGVMLGAIYKVFLRSVPCSPGDIEIRVTTRHVHIFEHQPYIHCSENIYPIDLKWGATHSFIPKNPCDANCVANQCSSSWVATFIDFRGNRRSFFMTPTDDPYLKIENVNGLSISAPQLSDLDELRT